MAKESPHVHSRKPGESFCSCLDRPEFLRGILKAMTIPCLVVDAFEKLVYVNQPYLDLYKRSGSPDDYLGQGLAEFFYADPDHPTYTGRAMAEGRSFRNLELTTKDMEGREVVVRYDVAPLYDKKGKLLGAFALIVDLTEIKRQEAEVERLAAFPRENPSPVISCAPDGEVEYMNPAAAGFMAKARLKSPLDMLSGNHQRIVETVLSNSRGRINVESEAGSRVFSWNYHPLDTGDRVHVYGQDVTVRKRVEEQLLHDAFHDGLTGLPNRTLFLDRLSQVLRHSRHGGNCFSVMLLDLDRFKNVNEGLGHSIGDQLIQKFARRIQGLLGPDDTLARLGGDEFAILARKTQNANQALTLAARLHETTETPFEVGGVDLFTSASVGIVVGPADIEDSEQMIRDADTAMYRAKREGRARSVVFEHTMHAHASERLSLEMDLKTAVENGQIVPYYQPLVSLFTGRISGFEALARWIHPDRGMVGPDLFIPLAEETGLIDPISRRIMETAFGRCAEWRGRYDIHRDLFMSVNLSVIQMNQPDVADSVARAIRTANLPFESVKIEITESGLMENTAVALRVLDEFQDLGVALSIDDFGTGYSSLSHLHRFPFHSLKVDRSFVLDIHNNLESLQIVKTILSLAHGLGKEVIAEGVENEDHLRILKELGCEIGQGYLFARPLPAEEAEALLRGDPCWLDVCLEP